MIREGCEAPHRCENHWPDENCPWIPGRYAKDRKTMTRTAATATVQIDNERVTVTEWRFAPGTETGWHIHPVDYVVVPLTTGELVLETRDATVVNALTAGVSYTRTAGSEHNVINDSGAEFVFVEIELK